MFARSRPFEWARRGTLSVLMVLFAVPSGALAAIQSQPADNTPAWATPSAMATRLIGPVDTAEHQPNFLSNLTCTSLTYRLINSSVMRTGCFTPTAFGEMDAAQSVVIFNGTDEGLPLQTFGPHESVAPWPSALPLIDLNAAPIDGSYLNIYRDFLTNVHDQRDALGRLTAKQLSGPADLQLKNVRGQPLIVNPQTLAFSSGGSWLVVETLDGYFVRINLATLEEVPFASAFSTEGSPAMYKSQVSVSRDGRFVAIENNSFSSFRVYDLANCQGSTAPMHCASYDYWPFVNRQLAGLISIGRVNFVNDNLISFEASIDAVTTRQVYELAPVDHIASLTNYVGLGDSYTSGEGAFDYLMGTDTVNNLCHLSVHSYPLLVTHDLFGDNGGHSVACSGAVINDITSDDSNYRGQTQDGQSLGTLFSAPAQIRSLETSFLPGYLPQHIFVDDLQPDVVTVSIGGNDIGFGNILQKCVEPHISLHSNANNCYATYEDRLEITNLVDRTVPRWVSLYKQLLSRSPGTRLYAIGYPQISVDNGNCADNVRLSQPELAFASQLIDYLNHAVQQAAQTANIPFVDVSQALAGHRLCETAAYNVAVNGLTAGTDSPVSGLGPLGRESYHPNALGHALIETAVLRATDNFKLYAVAAGGNDDSALLQVSKTGRTVNVLMPVNNLISGTIKKGTSTPLNVKGVSFGLNSNTAYIIHLDGSTGQQIGTLQSSASSDLFGQITIPASTSSGSHAIDIIGSNQNGEPIDITQQFYIPDCSCPRLINNRSFVDNLSAETVGAAATPTGAEASSKEASANVANVFFDAPATLLPQFLGSKSRSSTVSFSADKGQVRKKIRNHLSIGLIGSLAIVICVIWRQRDRG